MKSLVSDLERAGIKLGRDPNPNDQTVNQSGLFSIDGFSGYGEYKPITITPYSKVADADVE